MVDTEINKETVSIEVPKNSAILVLNVHDDGATPGIGSTIKEEDLEKYGWVFNVINALLYIFENKEEDVKAAFDELVEKENEAAEDPDTPDWAKNTEGTA